MALAGVAASYFYSTGPGKRSVWRDLLDELGLHGDEQVLDIGCGRGAVLSDRVGLVHADARDLPFAPESFDVVLSNLAISNIPGDEERANALTEAVRVLRPGGPLRIVDDRAEAYAPVLRSAGCVDIEVRRLDWRTWSGFPGHHFTLVAARKPT